MADANLDDAYFSRLLPKVIDIAYQAGEQVAKIYQTRNYQTKVKSDQTPVTTADLCAHQLITEQLKQFTPSLPVLSEEDCEVNLSERGNWDYY